MPRTIGPGCLGHGSGFGGNVFNRNQPRTTTVDYLDQAEVIRILVSVTSKRIKERRNKSLRSFEVLPDFYTRSLMCGTGICQGVDARTMDGTECMVLIIAVLL